MKIEVELTEKVWSRLSVEAEEVGVTIPELVRSILGNEMSDAVMGKREMLLHLARVDELECQTCGQGLTDPGTGLARVLAEHNARLGFRPPQKLTQRPPDEKNRAFVQRVFPGNGANPICSEQSRGFHSSRSN